MPCGCSGGVRRPALGRLITNGGVPVAQTVTRWRVKFSDGTEDIFDSLLIARRNLRRKGGSITEIKEPVT